MTNFVSITPGAISGGAGLVNFNFAINAPTGVENLNVTIITADYTSVLYSQDLALSATAPNFTVSGAANGIPIGNYYIKASSTDYAQQTGYIPVSVTTAASPPLSLTFLPPLGVSSGLDNDVTYTVTVTDNAGNPVSGVAVTASSTIAGIPATNASGVTTIQPFSSGNVSGVALSFAKAGHQTKNQTVNITDTPIIFTGAGTIGDGPTCSTASPLALLSTAPTAWAGTAPITYSLLGAPAGITINASTGALSSSGAASGSYPVYIVAENVDGATTYPITLTVTASATPPTYTGPSSINTPATITANGTGPITYAFSGAALGGLVIDPNTGYVTGSTPGTYSVTVVATNAAGPRTIPLSITVPLLTERYLKQGNNWLAIGNKLITALV